MRMLVLAWLGLVVGCGAKGSDSLPKPGRLVCDATFKFETSKPDKAFFKFSTDISSETKAIGQLNAAVLAYTVQADELCKQYNGGILDAAGFRERSDRISARLAKAMAVRPRIEEASQSKDLLERKEVLAGAYTALVPDDTRKDLTIDFSVSAELPANLDAVSDTPCQGPTPALLPPVPLAEGQTIPSGTRVAFAVTVSADAFVYLIQKNDQTGEITVLFPQPGQITTDNPLRPGQRLRIPDEGQHYCLNQKDIGLEKVMVVASLEPLPSLDAAMKAVEAAAKPSGAAAVTPDGSPASLELPTLSGLTQIGLHSEAAAGCRARALELVADVPPACTRSRGLVLEGTKGSSFRARTEAADTVIAKSFPFEHVAPARYQALAHGGDADHALDDGHLKSRSIRMEK